MGMCLAYCLILNFLNQILYIIFVKLERERKDLRLLFSLVQEERSKRFQVERLDDRR
jgi:hypothetical protein